MCHQEPQKCSDRPHTDSVLLCAYYCFICMHCIEKYQWMNESTLSVEFNITGAAVFNISSINICTSIPVFPCSRLEQFEYCSSPVLALVWMLYGLMPAAQLTRLRSCCRQACTRRNSGTVLRHGIIYTSGSFFLSLFSTAKRLGLVDDVLLKNSMHYITVTWVKWSLLPLKLGI